VWPAQIVWRRGLQVVQTSANIGIHCLTRDAIRNGWGKLQDLITQVRAIRAQQQPPADSTPADVLPPPPPEPLAPPAGPSTSPSFTPCSPRSYPRPAPTRPVPVCRQLSFTFAE
jgi:hypothetical protein